MFLIAGDDDHQSENNPGREKTLAAAKSVGGVAIFSRFSAEERAKGLRDFNDLPISEIGPQVFLAPWTLS
jgi:phage/plasmid primase-like uncharacterized protein